MTGVFHVADAKASTGASCTGSVLTDLFARAMSDGLRATAAMSSLVTVLLLAKPQVPSTHHADAEAVVFGVDDVLDARGRA